MANIFGNGLNVYDLVDLISLIKTNFNGVLAKLDLDAQVADTNYASTLSLSIPDGIQLTDAKCILHQGLVITFLQSVVTNFNALLAKLDADATVTQTNYVALLAMTDTVGDDKIDSLLDIGIKQSALVNFLDTFITKFNALNAKMDTDNGDTNYAALWNITDNVDEAGTVARP